MPSFHQPLFIASNIPLHFSHIRDRMCEQKGLSLSKSYMQEEYLRQFHFPCKKLKVIGLRRQLTSTCPMYHCKTPSAYGVLRSHSALAWKIIARRLLVAPANMSITVYIDGRVLHEIVKNQDFLCVRPALSALRWLRQ